jgi:hypothetical protein
MQTRTWNRQEQEPAAVLAEVVAGLGEGAK